MVPTVRFTLVMVVLYSTGLPVSMAARHAAISC